MINNCILDNILVNHSGHAASISVNFNISGVDKFHLKFDNKLLSLFYELFEYVV